MCGGWADKQTVMKRKREFQIDGGQFSDLPGFFDQISESLILGSEWGRNLDAFNDILRGGFGTPDEGFVFVWINSDESKRRLGYEETVKQLERRLERCHTTNRESVAQDLERARRFEGSTVFDWLVEIIGVHCSGGEEAEDGVELRLL